MTVRSKRSHSNAFNTISASSVAYPISKSTIDNNNLWSVHIISGSTLEVYKSFSRTSSNLIPYNNDVSCEI